MQKIARQFNPLLLEYLHGQINTGDPVRIKKALQEISRGYRRGYRIAAANIFAFENTVIGLISSQNDPKIRRWGLNALAQFGASPRCEGAVKDALARYSTDLEAVASGVAAIYRLSDEPLKALTDLQLDPLLVTLSALQHAPFDRVNRDSLPVDIDTASPAILKLSLILAGLDKYPDNIYGKYKINEIIRVLGGHDDPVVSQYSVWAITENQKFSVKDLGIPIKNIESKPPNVRAWIYQLLAMRPYAAQVHQEYLVLGRKEKNSEPRIGLATGLRETYFAGLESLTLDWVISEADAEVRELLIEHMIKQSSNCNYYENYVLDIYRHENDPRLRERMTACAAGLEIYGKFRKSEALPDLFRGVSNVTNNINFNGSVQAPGSVFGTGTVNNTNAQSQFNAAQISQVKSQLDSARSTLKALDVAGDDEASNAKIDAEDKVEVASLEPSPDRIVAAVNSMDRLAKLVHASTGLATALSPILDALKAACGL